MNGLTMFRIRSILYPIGIAVFLSIPNFLYAQCQDCGKKGFDHPHFPPTEEGAKAYYHELKTYLQDHSLDNPEDLTTQRINFPINEGFLRLPKSTREIYEPYLLPLLADAAKNDPYPQVRQEALMAIVYYKTIPKLTRYAIFTELLRNSNIMIRVLAARTITMNCKNDTINPDPLALRIVHDASIGKDRSIWDVRGFYSKADLQKDSGIIDSLRDRIQRYARMGLDGYGISSLDLLDSVSNNGATEELRKSAKRGAALR